MSAVLAQDEPLARPEARGAALLAAFNRNKLSWVGLVLLAVILAAALAAPWIAPYDPIAQSILDRMKPPGGAFLLGTDVYGRDVLSRILHGGRISLLAGITAVAIGLVLGGALGLIAGYYGGRIDTVVMRAVDVLLSFPTLIMGLLVLAMLGPSLVNIIIAIAATLVPKFARIARAPTQAVKERPYIEACRALGYSDARIMLVHILPNILAELLVLASLWTANAIQIEAGFSFIGLGVRPPAPTWGGMIKEGFEHMFEAPWLSIFPGLAILLTVLALNLLGDGIRDAVDPRLEDAG